MQHNSALAKHLAQIVDARPKQCYRNSVLALYAVKDAGPAGSALKKGPTVYVEGILRLDELGIAIDHGWLIVDDAIVDVTRQEPPDGYIPIIRYSRREVEYYNFDLKWDTPYYTHTWEHRRTMALAMQAAYAEIAGKHA
jgi:hypothetical protein